ncbi:regulatory protein, luxR family [Mycolicibacterium rutilum]|uniref:Regulatory protein, luxR family n=1 Tax=Mycolicibacterium rutilum TaxID=370526 RepID=A0A1H6ITK4_MYCRU|nr:LuxR family transcriptional regulator [Mycolicibacterium rutilum]SEH52969.1 regulatory protein, luxR family [Mycolicibacterium rutilum]
MSGQGAEQRLRGRAPECQVLHSLIADVRSGDGSRVLVLRGEAGVGKTALLDEVHAQATGFRVVAVSGVESDMELAFAGLQQLCAPLMNHLEELPEPQREALNVAFGRGIGDTPDRFLVGLAGLSLLAAAADEQPLLCIVDDAQWLDQVTQQTLGFIARRLLAEPVALVFAVREHPEVLAGLPELAVEGLSDTDARELLDSVMVGAIDPRVRDRIVAETRGIPLAILEVPRSVSATELAGGFWISGKRSSSAAVEHGFVRRIQALPAPTRQLLLLAAAEPIGDAALFMRAAAHLGVPVDELTPAEDDGLIEFGPRMRFHHPLIRSAAYRAAELGDRRAAHRALADATDPQADPDRRAWHAANAAVGPDDSVADELERSAARAQTRGGIAAAATFLERATALTADPARRVSRALAAAQAKRDVAASDAAHELLAVAELGRPSDFQRAVITRLRAQMSFVRSRAGEPGAPQLADTATPLLDAARQLDGVDDYSSRESFLEAIAALMYAGRLAEPDALTLAADAARAALRDVTELPRPVDYLLRGIAERIAGGVHEGAAGMRTALQAMCDQAETDESAVGRWLKVPGFPIMQETCAHELWDEVSLFKLSSAAVRHARAAGALAGLPRALVYRAGVHLVSGEFASAAQLLEEADSITAATGHLSPVRYHALLLAAWRGDAAEAGRLLDGAAADGVARGEGRLLGLTGYAAAILYNGLGRYQEAFTAASTACEYEDFGIYGWCAFELVEAATRTGDGETAAHALDMLAERAGASGTDWGLGALANARAMMADDDAAEALFTEAIERLGRTRIVVHLARTRLLYGEWLRRVNRRTDARSQLTEANEMFTRIGAQAFAERARRELVATGEKVRKQQAGTNSDLTAQEAQIARLAADGLTNQEIGAQLFISTHTVEWHLRKVFVKLGITSRRQLRTVSWAS